MSQFKKKFNVHRTKMQVLGFFYMLIENGSIVMLFCEIIWVEISQFIDTHENIFWCNFESLSNV